MAGLNNKNTQVSFSNNNNLNNGVSKKKKVLIASQKAINTHKKTTPIGGGVSKNSSRMVSKHHQHMKKPLPIEQILRDILFTVSGPSPSSISSTTGSSSLFVPSHPDILLRSFITRPIASYQYAPSSPSSSSLSSTPSSPM